MDSPTGTVDAIVDTRAGPLVITEAMQQRLGLEIEKEESVFLAGKVPQKCVVAEAVDLKVNPIDRCLEGARGDKQRYQVRYDWQLLGLSLSV
ncbi:MAG: retropepsin-like domain-containing protein [Treponema sp.]|nr:retropepsin-like domain-containing protein [Treponema sp.]